MTASSLLPSCTPTVSCCFFFFGVFTHNAPYISQSFNPWNRALVRSLTVKNFRRQSWFFLLCFHRLRSASWPGQPRLQTMWVTQARELLRCLLSAMTCVEASGWFMSFSLFSTKYHYVLFFSLSLSSSYSTVWKPKMLNVSQLGSNLHVVFDHAPPTFGFNTYYLYYKLRQESHFKLKRCKPVSTLHLGLN